MTIGVDWTLILFVGLAAVVGVVALIRSSLDGKPPSSSILPSQRVVRSATGSCPNCDTRLDASSTACPQCHTPVQTPSKDR